MSLSETQAKIKIPLTTLSHMYDVKQRFWWSVSFLRQYNFPMTIAVNLPHRHILSFRMRKKNDRKLEFLLAIFIDETGQALTILYLYY